MSDFSSFSAQQTGANPEQKQEKALRRKVAFSFWRQQWRAANPDATREQEKEAWAAARPEQTKMARRALKRLERQGIAVTYAGVGHSS